SVPQRSSKSHFMPARDLIFVSYSNKDKKICHELLKGLDAAAEALKLKVWSDHQIPVGADWRAEIETALRRACVAVCIISPDYLTSCFVLKDELPPLLAAAETGGTAIFCIACRPSLVAHTKLGKYQAANDPNKPLSTLVKKDRETAIVDIVNKLISVA